MADTNHSSWVSFYGNIVRSERRERNQTVYAYVDGKGKSSDFITNLTKSQFKDLALLELSVFLTEAGNIKLQDFIDKVKSQPDYEFGSDYSLEYAHANKLTNEVEHKIVAIPVRFIIELDKDSKKKESSISVF